MHWYTPLELAKRMGFYHSCQAIGGMMSGAIQAAISTSLHGQNGLAGWRYAFLPPLMYFQRTDRAYDMEQMAVHYQRSYDCVLWLSRADYAA